MDETSQQNELLDVATEKVRKNAFDMNCALDKGNMREGIVYASKMVSELRSSELSPQNYYDLYMTVTHELRELMTKVEDMMARHVVNINELYDHVQHSANIIPRMYLLITVGSCFIRSKEVQAKDILYDLVELCRGIQHPMRGLFLRDFLSQVSRDKLPGTTNCQYEGDVKESIHFILTNFSEMNKLWVRMQHQGAVKDRQKRELERRNLRQLVGTNLVRLSEIESIDADEYKDHVFPRILEQIVNCKDVIAQEYLMDCIIQVFPDEFHLATLETFLGTCSQLQDKVNVKTIIENMMNRLSNFALQSRDRIPSELKMFNLFHKYSQKVIEVSGSMKLHDILSLQVALVNFTSKCYPDKLNHIDHVLQFSAETISKSGYTSDPVTDPKESTHIVNLLSSPLETLSVRILELKHYASLMNFLAVAPKKRVALAIVSAVVKSGTALDDVEKADVLFRYLSPLIHNEDSNSDNNVVPDDERFEFDQEQTQVAQMFQLIGSDNTDVHFQLYQIARKHFGAGGTARIEYTLPPLVFGSFELAKRMFHKRDGKKSKQVFGFIHETLSCMVDVYPELSLRLFVQAAQAASVCGFEAIAYEFVAQAFIAYEESISDSKAQFAALNYIVSSLHEITTFSTENYDTLSSKATQHASKLLKKTDQCRAVFNCAHLFWQTGDDEIETNEEDDEESENNKKENKVQSTPYREEKRVLACLQRALKIANACMGSQLHLFVEILNKYLYFFGKDCPSINPKYIKGLIDLINEHAPSLDNSSQSKMAKKHYENTIAHIRYKESMDGEIGEKYAQIYASFAEEE